MACKSGGGGSSKPMIDKKSKSDEIKEKKNKSGKKGKKK